MKILHVDLFGLPAGIRWLAFESIDECERLKPGYALDAVNRFTLFYSINYRASRMFSDRLTEVTGIPCPTRNFSQHVATIRAKLEKGEAVPGAKLGESADTFLQRIADTLVPVDPLATYQRSAVDRKCLEQARVILANGNRDKWEQTLVREGISLDPWQNNHELDAIILARGLEAYKAKEMEREFV